jgi:hypothetical protein
MAHDMGSKDVDTFALWVERMTNQIWWLFTNPKTGSPFQPPSYE